MRILLLCDYRPYNAATVCDHINAFHSFSIHDMMVYSNMVQNNGRLPASMNLDEFHAVVLHYSLFLAIDAYISPHARNRLKAFHGLKVIFIQDEYRFVNATVHHLKDIGFDLLFTCVPGLEVEKVYPSEFLPGLRKINTLTGYVPAPLLNSVPKPLSKRKYHVSYRGRRYPAWHGRLGQEKWQIAQYFRENASAYGLRTNISCKEGKRLYGSRWTKLIQNSRAVLGVESGASVFDFSGEIAAKVETYTALLDKDFTDPDHLRSLYYKGLEDQIDLAQISPRIFEAIALRTLCILYEGHYSGILEPGKHYLALQKDHSNFKEIVGILKNDRHVAQIITQAYGDIAVNERYSYATFIKEFDQAVQEGWDRKNPPGPVSDPVFANPKKFYHTFPFTVITDPYSLDIPLRSRLLSTLLPKIPAGLKRSIKRWIFQQ